VFYRTLGIAILTAALPAAALSAQSTPRPATAAPAAPAQAPNRAALIRNLDANFKAIDTNGNGTLEAAELGAAEIKSQTMRNNQLRVNAEANFTKLDTNKDGQLNKAEFLALVPNRPVTGSNGNALVTPLDRNKDNKVSADEYRAPMLTRFDQLDTNKNGVIDPAERAAVTRR
jgi:hypothetical protein